MKALYDIAAPAKLNLFLHITGRRQDGYHLLQSAFALIDLQDTLHFERLTSSNISRSDTPSTTALPSQDLCVRAAQLLQQTTGCTMGVRIHLDKRIPTQAGMGGGSSDAASCLIALNRLWNTQLTQQQLMSLGLQLGADVPFFIHGTHAWVQGIGEQLTPIHLDETHFLLSKPDTGLDTAQIFKDPGLHRSMPEQSLAAFNALTTAEKIQFGTNALQPIAQHQCPAISEHLQWMRSLDLLPRMTGSGSTIFAPLAKPLHPPFRHLPPNGWTHECRTIHQHPLKNW